MEFSVEGRGIHLLGYFIVLPRLHELLDITTQILTNFPFQKHAVPYTTQTTLIYYNTIN